MALKTESTMSGKPADRRVTDVADAAVPTGVVAAAAAGAAASLFTSALALLMGISTCFCRTRFIKAVEMVAAGS